MFESPEQRVCDQARATRKNGCLSEHELEAIKRQVEDGCQGELCREQDGKVDVETDIGTVEEEINDVEDGIGDTERDLREEHQVIVEQFKKIVLEGRTGDDIIFKKVDKKVLKVQTEGVNEVIKYLKSKSITETNNLIRAASVWVATQTGLNKAEHRKKNKPRWKRRIEGDIKRQEEKRSQLSGKGSYGRTGIEEKMQIE